MAHRVCPWWMGGSPLGPLRRATQDPTGILAPHVREGHGRAGAGTGAWDSSRSNSRVWSGRRDGWRRSTCSRACSTLCVAAPPGRASPIASRPGSPGPNSLGVADLAGKVDFILAFAVVHELADARTFFAEAAACLRPGGALLFAEPSGHVTTSAFEDELRAAADAGLTAKDHPAI